MSRFDEGRLRIEAYSPKTMPMARLAEYLSELAELLGENTSVHFVRLEEGSTSIVHRIQSEAIPKIVGRTRGVARGVGPRDAVRAYGKINRMVREDNGRATWQLGSLDHLSGEVVIFPGKDDTQRVVASGFSPARIDGEVLRVGGANKYVPVLMAFENEEFAGCSAERSLAKELARHLFEPVRLYGYGRWQRDEDGRWKLDRFRIDRFTPLKKVGAVEAFDILRAMEIGWDATAFTGLLDLQGQDPEDFGDRL